MSVVEGAERLEHYLFATCDDAFVSIVGLVSLCSDFNSFLGLPLGWTPLVVTYWCKPQRPLADPVIFVSPQINSTSPCDVVIIPTI